MIGLSKGIGEDYEKITIADTETISHAVCDLCGRQIYVCPVCNDYMMGGQRIICKRVCLNSTHKHADCDDSINSVSSGGCSGATKTQKTNLPPASGDI